jgi:hypothetical protein
MKNKLLMLSLIAVVLVASVNFVANFLYLYWSYWWFDNISHFLGGLAMGFFWFLLFKRFYKVDPTARFSNILLTVLTMVAVIGIGWEIFEYAIGGANPSVGETYWQDTSYDLVADVFGAFVATVTIYKNKLHV